MFVEARLTQYNELSISHDGCVSEWMSEQEVEEECLEWASIWWLCSLSSSVCRRGRRLWSWRMLEFELSVTTLCMVEGGREGGIWVISLIWKNIEQSCMQSSSWPQSVWSIQNCTGENTCMYFRDMTASVGNGWWFVLPNCWICTEWAIGRDRGVNYKCKVSVKFNEMCNYQREFRGNRKVTILCPHKAVSVAGVARGFSIRHSLTLQDMLQPIFPLPSYPSITCYHHLTTQHVYTY